MMAVPRVDDYLTEASYHRYVGATDANLNLIHGRAAANGLDTSHLELIGATHHDLHKDIELAWCSAWAQFTLAAKHTVGDNGGQYYLIDDTVPSAPVIVPGWRTKYLRQYFRYIRPGALRVGATSTHFGIEPLMFQHATVGDVLVAKCNAGRTFHVVGLEAGTYGVRYTTSTEDDVDAGDVALIPGQIPTVSIPSFGVITVYRK